MVGFPLKIHPKFEFFPGLLRGIDEGPIWAFSKTENPGPQSYMSHDLNSLKVGYIGGYVWDYYRGPGIKRGRLGVSTMAHMEARRELKACWDHFEKS